MTLNLNWKHSAKQPADPYICKSHPHGEGSMIHEWIPNYGCGQFLLVALNIFLDISFSVVIGDFQKLSENSIQEDGYFFYKPVRLQNILSAFFTAVW